MHYQHPRRAHTMVQSKLERSQPESVLDFGQSQSHCHRLFYNYLIYPSLTLLIYRKEHFKFNFALQKLPSLLYCYTIITILAR